MICEQVGTAGSKIQTQSGRLLFAGHADGTGCRWWSDDGGQTFNCTDPYPANEVSVAETFPVGSIYMNGRGLVFPWKGNRTSSFSDDDGTTFGAPEACPIKEDQMSGCSVGLVSDDTLNSTKNQMPRLYLSEPQHPKRLGLVVHCSLDGGHTWPVDKIKHINGDQPAAYSALRMVNVLTESGKRKRRLLVSRLQNDCFIGYCFPFEAMNSIYPKTKIFLMFK